MKVEAESERNKTTKQNKPAPIHPIYMYLHLTNQPTNNPKLHSILRTAHGLIRKIVQYGTCTKTVRTTQQHAAAQFQIQASDDP